MQERKLVEGQGKIVLKNGVSFNVDISCSLSELVKLLKPLKDGSLVDMIKKVSVSGGQTVSNPFYITPYCRLKALLLNNDPTHPELWVELSQDKGKTWKRKQRLYL